MVEKLIKEAFRAGITASEEYIFRQDKDKKLDYWQWLDKKAQEFISKNKKRIKPHTNKTERGWKHV